MKVVLMVLNALLNFYQNLIMFWQFSVLDNFSVLSFVVFSRPHCLPPFKYATTSVLLYCAIKHDELYVLKTDHAN